MKWLTRIELSDGRVAAKCLPAVAPVPSNAAKQAPGNIGMCSLVWPACRRMAGTNPQPQPPRLLPSAEESRNHYHLQDNKVLPPDVDQERANKEGEWAGRREKESISSDIAQGGAGC